MKKLIAVLFFMSLVACMFSGCATINGWLCHPTPAQQEAVDTAMAMANTILGGVATLTGNPVVTLIAADVMPILKKGQAGYCLANEEWQAAIAALQSAAAQSSTTKAVATKQIFADLSAVRW